MLSTRFAAAALGACAVITPVIASAPASAAPVSDASARSATQVTSARMSTMDCNGVTFQHNGYSYGWGNSRNRVIFGFGSAGNIRAVKVYGDGIASATWTIGAISKWGGATVASSGTGATYCVQVSNIKGVDLKSRYPGGATASETIYVN